LSLQRLTFGSLSRSRAASCSFPSFAIQRAPHLLHCLLPSCSFRIAHQSCETITFTCSRLCQIYSLLLTARIAKGCNYLHSLHIRVSCPAELSWPVPFYTSTCLGTLNECMAGCGILHSDFRSCHPDHLSLRAWTSLSLEASRGKHQAFAVAMLIQTISPSHRSRPSSWNLET
jgi:hypothetical protein